MNEAVILKFGADTSLVARALRSVKSMVQDFRKNLSESFSSGFKNFGALITVAGIAKGIGALREMTDGIKDLAEATGTTTKFSQAWGQMGDQFGDNADGANKALEKFTVNLGEALNGSESATKKFSDMGVSLGGGTEAVLKRVADKIASIPDPARKAAAAMELFGKSGQGIVGILNQGSAGIDKFVESASIVSDASLEAIDAADKELKAFTNRAKVLGAEVIGYWATIWKRLGRMSVDGAKIPSLSLNVDYSQAEAEEAAQLLRTKQEVEKVDAKIAEIRAKQAEFAQKNRTNEEQLRDALKESGELAEKGLAAQSGSKEAAEIRLKHEKKSLEIMDLQKKVQKEKDEAAKKASEEKQKALEKEKKTQEEIETASKDAADRREDFDITLEDRSKFSLEELSNLNTRRFRGISGDIFDAREVKRLEDEGKRLRGIDFEGSQDAFNRADKLRSGISSLQEKDRLPFKAMEEGIVKAEQHLSELVEKAAGEGLKMKPVMGK